MAGALPLPVGATAAGAHGPAAGAHATTAILALWLPSLVAANLFGAFWMVKAWFDMEPRQAAALRARLAAACRSCTLGAHRRRAAKRRVTAAGPGGPGSGGDAIGSRDARVMAEALEAPPLGAELGSPNSSRRGARSSGSRGASSSSGGSSAGGGAGGGRLCGAEVAGVRLDWRGLSCSYSTSGGIKHVLDDVFGAAAPGEMLALMGPSGAGKSTLLDMLAQRKATGRLGGVLLVDGAPAGPGFAGACSYVPQSDNFLPVMTALETLQFYAGVSLPPSWGAARAAARVEEALCEMGLSHARLTLVGGELPGGLLLRGLSGGERKRLSIAAGVLAAPSALFLDEPTTGLDAFAALTVMGYLKRMARENGQVVVTSIHQPRAAIWSMFDSVSLLSCGRLLYHGPRDGLVPWFESLGFEYLPESAGTAPDWALDLVAVGSHKPHPGARAPRTFVGFDQVATASVMFVRKWMAERGMAEGDMPLAAVRGGARGGDDAAKAGPKAEAVAAVAGGKTAAARGGGSWGGGWPNWTRDGSLQQQQQQQQQQATRAPAVERPPYSAAPFPPAPPGCPPAPAAAWLRKARWCYRREVLMVTRNPMDVAGRTMTFAWVAAMTGVLYYALPPDASGARLRVNMLLNSVAFFCLMPYLSLGLYMADKKVYMADAAAKLIPPSAYYLAKVAATLPFQLPPCLAFTTVIYGLSGLRPEAGAVLANGALAAMMSLIAVQVMHACAVAAPTQDMAFMYSIAWTAVQLLLNNFSITFREMALPWMRHLRWLSAAYFAFEGMSVVEFRGQRVPCAGGLGASGYAFLRELLPRSRLLALRPVEAALASPGDDCFIEMAPALQFFGFSRGFWPSFVMLLGYYLITHVLTFLSILRAARRERR